MTTIKGTAYFCKHQKPAEQTKVGGFIYPRRYEISVGLDADEQKKAKKLGLVVKPANEKIPVAHTKITSKCELDEEVETRRPIVYYGKTPGFSGFIFNESKVNVIGDIKDFNGKPKFMWRAIQILELAPQPEGWSEPVDVESELEDVVPSNLVDVNLNDDLFDLP